MSLHNLPALILEVGRRRTERHIATALSAAAFACPWLGTELSLLGAGVCAAGAAAATIWGFWRDGWIGGRNRLTRIVWLGDGRWLLFDRSGTSTEAVLTDDSRVAQRLVWLAWRTTSGRSRVMCLRSGDLNPRDLRALAVRVRVQGLRITDVALAA